MNGERFRAFSSFFTSGASLEKNIFIVITKQNCLRWKLTGFSSPSIVSSLVKYSRHCPNRKGPCRWGIGNDRSQNGSKVTEQCPQWVQRKVDFNCPTKMSTTLLLSIRRYLCQDSEAFWESLERVTRNYNNKLFFN